MNKAIIFHHLGPAINTQSSGSTVRPLRLLNAFQELGYQVEVVSGNRPERAQTIKRLQYDLKQGRRFAFAYSESSTQPTLLADPARGIHLHPFVDFDLFRTLRNHHIPLGLYYRDIHWRFEQYRKKVRLSKRIVTIPLYWFDWFQYLRYLDCLFLPSLEMRPDLPTQWSSRPVIALPPGCNTPVLDEVQTTYSPEIPLRLLYVGGVVPPLYNLQPLFELVRQCDGIKLTLCCREAEWRSVQGFYGPIPPSRVEVIYASGADLDDYYRRAHVFALVWQPYPYLDFAMPVKVFESLGFALPIVTTAGTLAARFIKEEKIGWVCSSSEELRSLLAHLQQHPDAIQAVRKQMLSVREHHTWLARARTVAQALQA